MLKIFSPKNKHTDKSETLPSEIPTTSGVINNLGQTTRQFAAQGYDAMTGTAGKALDMFGRVSTADVRTKFKQLFEGARNVGENFTGEAFFNAAGNLLDQQMQYNNVLATRLAEALESIEALNRRVCELEKKNENR